MPFNKQEWQREYMRRYRREHRTPQAKQVHQACDATMEQQQALIEELKLALLTKTRTIERLEADLALERLAFG